jgi:hypothetical protein
VGEKCLLSGNFAEITTSTPFRDLLHGTDDFTSPPKEGVLRIFFAVKNPTASARFEPANLGTKGQHATPRPPQPMPTPYAEEITGDHQCGFRCNSSATDHVICIRPINWSTLHELFIDLKKAYDSVRREVLYNMLFEFGITLQLVRLIKVSRMNPIGESG